MGGNSSRTTSNGQGFHGNYDHQEYSPSNYNDQRYNHGSQPYFNFNRPPTGQINMFKSIPVTLKNYDEPYGYGTRCGQDNNRRNNTEFRGERPVAKPTRWENDTRLRDSRHEQVDKGWGHDTYSRKDYPTHQTPLDRVSSVTIQEPNNNRMDDDTDFYEQNDPDASSDHPDFADNTNEYRDENNQTRTGSDAENDNHRPFTAAADDDNDGNNDQNDSEQCPTPELLRAESMVPSIVRPESDIGSNPPVDFSDDEDEVEEETNAPAESPPAKQRQRRRLALIFGNDSYASPHDLHSCCKDAEDMKTALTSLGFTCTLLLNGRQRDMKSAEKSFRDKLRQGDCVLVYFSGHGMEDKGKNYIVPIHPDDDRTDPEYDFICVEGIIQRLNEKKDIINIIILDACRSDENNTTYKKSGFASSRDAPAFGKSLSTRLIAPPDAEYCIIYSCDPGRVSLGSGPGNNSKFTGALLENITHPGMEIENVLKETSKQLKRLTGGKQRPWSNSCLSESFFFNPPS